MKAKPSTKHPYAAIEHRVIDSPAYADLSHSACRLLTLLARQLTRDNNGHLQASFKWCSKYGIRSEHTLRSAIADLISHGFIYRTRSHGANGAWARYAVTWLPITRKEGLFLFGFEPCAWRSWEPQQKKSSPQKMPDQSSRNCSFTTENPAETAGTLPVKTAAYELMPCRGGEIHISGNSESTRTYRPTLVQGYRYRPRAIRRRETTSPGNRYFKEQHP